MFDLRDPIWASIFSIIAILVSVSIFFLERKKKSLTYETISEASLLTLNEELNEKVQILYDGKVIKDVYLIILKIRNNGNSAILEKDFIKPIQINFSDKTQILSAEIIRTIPSNLNVEISLRTNQIGLAPVLLNSGDSISLKLLLTGHDGVMHLNGRIVGVREIKKSTSPTIFINKVEVNSLMVGVILYTIGIIVLFNGIESKSDIILRVGALLIMSPALALVIGERIRKVLEKIINKN